jgi:hypothetical protein
MTTDLDQQEGVDCFCVTLSSLGLLSTEMLLILHVCMQVPNIVLYPPPQPPEVAPATGTLSSRSSAAASIAEEDVGTAGTGAAVSHASQGVLNKGEVSSNMGAKAAGGMLASTQVPPHLHQASEGSSSSYETDTDDTGSYVTEEEKEDEGQEHRGTDTAKPVLGGMQPSQPHTVRRPESLSLGGAGPHAAQGPGSQARGGAQVPGRPISAAAGAQSGPQDKEAAIAAYLQRPEFQVVPIELSLRGAHAMESVRVVGDSQGEEAQQGTGVGGRVDRWSDWDMGDNQVCVCECVWQTAPCKSFWNKSSLNQSVVPSCGKS